jgi:hypothetical protein
MIQFVSSFLKGLLIMVKKLLVLAVASCSLAACASWFGGGDKAPQEQDNPAVGSKQGSNMLFPAANASAPVASAPAKVGKSNASVAM